MNNNKEYNFVTDTRTQNILNARGWRYIITNVDVTLTWYTPYGGEYSFLVATDNTLSEISFHAADFNVDDYVKLFINHLGEDGVPSTVKDLLEDAEAISDELKALDEVVNFPDNYQERYDMGHIGNLRIYRDNTTNTFLVCRGEGVDEEILNEENDLHVLLRNIAEYYIGLI